MTQRHFIRCLLLVGVALTCTADAALANSSSAATPLFGGYWHEFLEHWGGVFKKQNGIIMAALGVGALSLFIITRGKWKK